MNYNEEVLNGLHRVQLRILDELDSICREHDIPYYLSYGTLLGAIRHNGFIPWDDDIDVMMRYEDLQRLIALGDTVWNKCYFLQTHETDPEYNKSYGKIRDSRTTFITEDLADRNVNQGVDIDIYPLVELAGNPVMRLVQYTNAMLYMLLLADRPPMNHGGMLAIASKLILRVIPNSKKESISQRALATVIKIAKRHREHSKYYCILCPNIRYLLAKHKRAWFEKSIYHKFEDRVYPVPIGYDEWLRNWYGAYWELPPVKDRGIKLEAITIDLTNPYLRYKGTSYCVN